MQVLSLRKEGVENLHMPWQEEELYGPCDHVASLQTNKSCMYIEDSYHLYVMARGDPKA